MANQPPQRTGSREAVFRARWPAAERQVVGQHLLRAAILLLPLLLTSCEQPPRNMNGAVNARSSLVYEALIESEWFDSFFGELARSLNGGYVLEEHAVGGPLFSQLEVRQSWMADPCWPTLDRYLGDDGPTLSIANIRSFSATDEAEAFGTSRATAERYAHWREWPAFHTRYPNTVGVLGLSQVAFNSAGSRAMLYVQAMYGGSIKAGGCGWFVRLSCDSSRWIVEDAVISWVHDDLLADG